MSSILDKVITSQYKEKLSKFNPHQVLNSILDILSEREQEIIKMRHGLSNYPKKTLEEIGNKYNITRERVRQIEKASLKKVIDNFDKTYLKEIEDVANGSLSEHGGLMSEENLILDLLSTAGNTEENRAAIHFILSQLLKHRFHFNKENKEINNFWKTPEASLDYFTKVIDNIHNLLSENKEVLKLNDLIEEISKKDFYINDDNLTERVIINYIDITKKLAENPYEEWGLKEWANITPKRMNDKIYIILQKKKEPMHFTDIADHINRIKFDNRKAFPATIHNELILDKKYVLVGRGIYALQEWGYEPGVVSDVVADILIKADIPLYKKDIIEQVLKKRLIKKTTISLALMDKDKFIKDEKGRYCLA